MHCPVICLPGVSVLSSSAFTAAFQRSFLQRTGRQLPAGVNPTFLTCLPFCRILAGQKAHARGLRLEFLRGVDRRGGVFLQFPLLCNRLNHPAQGEGQAGDAGAVRHVR